MNHRVRNTDTEGETCNLCDYLRELDDYIEKSNRALPVERETVFGYKEREGRENHLSTKVMRKDTSEI